MGSIKVKMDGVSELKMVKSYYEYEREVKEKRELAQKKNKPLKINRTKTKEKYTIIDTHQYILEGNSSRGNVVNGSRIIFLPSCNDDNEQIVIGVRNGKSKAEATLRRIEEFFGENVELKDTEIEGTLITVDMQREYFKRLKKSLEEYIDKFRLIKSKAGDEQPEIEEGESENNKTKKYSISINNEDITYSIEEKGINIVDNNVSIANNIHINDVAQDLNNEIKISELKLKIEELKASLEGKSEEEKSKLKTEIEDLEKELKQAIQKKIEYRNILEQETRNSTNINVLFNIYSFYQEIIKTYAEEISNSESKLIILEEQIQSYDDTKKASNEFLNMQKEQQKLVLKIAKLKLYMQIATDKKNKINAQIKVLTEKKAKSKTPVNSTLHTNSSVDENPISNPKADENSTENHFNTTSNTKNKKSLIILLDYNNLKFIDKYRAKKLAFRQKNNKMPGIFQKLRLLLPSRKYKKLASEYIQNGNIKINDVVRDVDKYRAIAVYEDRKNPDRLSKYNLDYTPIVENNEQSGNEAQERIEERE